jgi:hypothetical protein
MYRSTVGVEEDLTPGSWISSRENEPGSTFEDGPCLANSSKHFIQKRQGIDRHVVRRVDFRLADQIARKV